MEGGRAGVRPLGTEGGGVMEESREQGKTALFLLFLFIVAAAVLFAFPPKKATSEAAKTGGDNDTGQFLSGNEVMSRNQLNLLSEVHNEFFDCIGYGSCVMTTDNSVETTEDNRTNTTVNGDRNVIIGSDGTELCQDPSTGIYSACQQ
jgi:hypothetical protein